MPTGQLSLWMDVMRGIDPVIDDYERLFDAWATGGVNGPGDRPAELRRRLGHLRPRPRSLPPLGCGSPRGPGEQAPGTPRPLRAGAASGQESRLAGGALPAGHRRADAARPAFLADRQRAGAGNLERPDHRHAPALSDDRRRRPRRPGNGTARISPWHMVRNGRHRAPTSSTICRTTRPRPAPRSATTIARWSARRIGSTRGCTR